MKKPVICILSAAILAGGCLKGARAPREYTPLVSRNAFVLSAYNSTAITASPMFAFFREWNAALDKEVAKYDIDKGLGKEAAAQLRETLQSGDYSEMLRKFGERGKWTVATVGRLKFTAADIGRDKSLVTFPDIACVTLLRERREVKDSVDDFKALLQPLLRIVVETATDTAALDSLREAFETSTEVVAGCEVWRWHLKNVETTADLLDLHVSGFEPCLGVYDGTLEVFASSPAVFEDVVALYSGNAEAAPADSAIARDATFADGNHAVFGIYGINEALASFAGDKLDEAPEEAARYLKSVGDLRVAEKFDDEAMRILLDFDVSFDDENLPQYFAGICNGGIGMAKAAIAMAALQNPELAPVSSLLNNISVAASGNQCKFALAITKDFLEKLNIAALARQLSEMKKGGGDNDDLFGPPEDKDNNGDADGEATNN